ncbi:hypothetical protein IE077_003776 [Cardiosporidium cionae]|uniref:Uncharacterized protein n=1 Tax=Cardiosporidium cionae TaxID=476202 RepID=A0ABQ7J7M9_9APIC|nr:hypothetical protein IE077_003776 [Cardiosporidium cionae]|eukprot:KAF8819944.1 hypothetical protein IE077_003776 [Cardiosporidium cionae]
MGICKQSLRWKHVSLSSIHSLSQRFHSNGNKQWTTQTRLPVSSESLAAIPWINPHKLSHLIQEVASRGPSTPSVWSKLLARTHVIYKSFTYKDIQRILPAMGKANIMDPHLFDLWKTSIWKKEMASASAMACSSIAHGLCEISLYDADLWLPLISRFQMTVKDLDSLFVALSTRSFAKSGFFTSELERCIIHCMQTFPHVDGKTMAIFCCALASLSQQRLSLVLQNEANTKQPLLESSMIQGLTYLTTAHTKAFLSSDSSSLTRLSAALTSLSWSSLGPSHKEFVIIIMEELMKRPKVE